MTVAVVSACYGNHDHIEPPPAQTVDAEWVMVTDDTQAPGWSTVTEPRPHMHPRLAAKVPKCLPWDYTDAEIVVWVDASFRFTQPDTLEHLVNAAEGPISQIRHPERDCVYAEAEFSKRMAKYAGQPLDAQANHYRHLGHPEHGGLWACGLIVYRRPLHSFGRRWLAEQVRWTYQDQISHPVALAAHGLDVHPLPWPLHGSGLFGWAYHRTDR